MGRFREWSGMALLRAPPGRGLVRIIRVATVHAEIEVGTEAASLVWRGEPRIGASACNMARKP